MSPNFTAARPKTKLVAHLARLTKEGLPDAAIQLISGHSSRKSLEVYQHLSLSRVESGYQKAVRGLEI